MYMYIHVLCTYITYMRKLRIISGARSVQRACPGDLDSTNASSHRSVAFQLFLSVFQCKHQIFRDVLFFNDASQSLELCAQVPLSSAPRGPPTARHESVAYRYC